MPSSLIIVALAAAWLVVLVPMIARKRQAVAQTTDSALAARVVRSGSGAEAAEEEFAMTQTVQQVADPEPDELEDDDFEYADSDETDRPEDVRHYRPDRDERRYRPGRGGFDPEAAEIAARAKYAFRQRIVLALILVALLTAGGGAFLTGMLWWVQALVDVALVSYLVYLRRQVRIENEIRQRRLARLDRARRRAASRRDVRDEYEVTEEPRPQLVGIERRPSPASRMRGRAVVVDVDDEDPAFHELDDPGQLPFRRAVGE